MSGPQLEIQLVAVLTAVACALPGTFLVLRRMAMLSDAISHSILLGIVLAFFVTESISSPLLIAGAAAVGVLTVALVELLHRSRLVREDAAIGLVFPTLFSIAVILISRYAGDVHLDVDAVLLGELAFAPLERVVVAGWDVGPVGAWVMAAILALDVVFVGVLYKELKVSTFDPALAAALGFSPALLHYALMGLVSVTAVGAFDVVGSVLVVALMIAPPATAYLLTDRLSHMLVAASAIGAFSAVSGYWLAHALDASIAGSMASAAGACFAIAFAFAPDRGLVAVARRRALQRWELAHTMLAIHLLNHEGRPEEAEESRVDGLDRHLRWEPGFVAQVVRGAERRGLVERRDATLALTENGRDLARRAIVA
ncbi:MAG TPA: metal ABC transporter permease [Actinomycetota bacterium]|nr:metal ABC transporter permease [Actinomycetota bacterium]